MEGEKESSSMASKSKPPKGDTPSTYMVLESKKKAEIRRLVLQDHLITTAMGGVLAEQADPSIFHRLLDVGCGPGGWMVETAQMYPEMHLVGLDINPQMLEYAREQVNAHHLKERVEFREMDVLHGLDFPEDSFDLVNLRFGISYVRTWDWPLLLREMWRVARPGGILRVTECEVGTRSTSPALTKISEISVQALYQAGYFFTKETAGLTAHLKELLTKCWCEDVQTKAYPLSFHAETPEGRLFIEDLSHVTQAMYPFMHKWVGISKEEYDVLYQQACKEMEQPDFHAIWPHLTAWGRKPLPYKK